MSDATLAQVAEIAIDQHDLISVQTFIRDHFNEFRPAPFHELLPNYPWRTIATVNYDLIVERAFQDTGKKAIIPWISNNDRPQNARKSPSDIMLLKLHGCISRVDDPNVPLILTPDQYADAHAGRENVFAELQQLASESTLIFAGTSVQDVDVRQLLLWLDSKIKSRPRGYILQRNVDEMVRDFWGSKRFATIEADFERFMTSLSTHIKGIASAIRIDVPHDPVLSALTTDPSSLSENCLTFLTQDVDYVRTDMSVGDCDPDRFYMGLNQGWGPIERGLDCPRRLTDFLLNRLIDIDHDGPTVHLVRAGAGAGKSVFLRRTAWDMADALKMFCLYLHDNADLDVGAVLETCANTDQRLFLILDDTASRVTQLNDLVFRAKREKAAISIITAERTNEWNNVANWVGFSCDTDDELFYLNEKEVRELLLLLKKHDSLGSLKGKTHQFQIDSIFHHAGGQLLVALHEALSGKKFEDIVLDEYRRVVPRQAKEIYLAICTLNRTGVPVRAGLISRMFGVSFDKFQEEFFSPLEHVVYCHRGKRGYDYEYFARHPYIADLVFDQVFVNREDLVGYLLNILDHLNLSYDSDASSYRQLINHKSLRGMFSDFHQVQVIFNRAEELFPDDGHLWLHRGLYEMRHDSGSFDTASDYLTRAGEFGTKDKFLNHARAQLELRRAEATPVASAREAHRLRAEGLVSSRFKANRDDDDEYTYSTRMRIALSRVSDAIANEAAGDDELSEHIAKTESLLAEGLSRFPGDSYLLGFEADFANMLKKGERAEAALRKAVVMNPRNVTAATRLASMLIEKGEKEEAMQIINKAAQANRTDKKLNFRYAQLLLRENGNPAEIETILRRAFVPGDKHFYTQFLYARQLYVNGKEPEAHAAFEMLREARVFHKDRKVVRFPVVDGDELKIYRGTVIKLDYSFGFVRIGGSSTDIYLPPTVISTVGVHKLSEGQQITFSLGFNYSGPAVYEILAAPGFLAQPL